MWKQIQGEAASDNFVSFQNKWRQSQKLTHWRHLSNKYYFGSSAVYGQHSVRQEKKIWAEDGNLRCFSGNISLESKSGWEGNKKLEKPIFHEKHDLKNWFVVDSEVFWEKKVHFIFRKEFSVGIIPTYGPYYWFKKTVYVAFLTL